MRRKIVEGEWSAGIMVPSRKSLAKSYGVDLRTVQRAIAALLEDGTLKAESGRGTFVPNSNNAERSLSSWLQARDTSQTVGIVFHRFFSPTAPGPRATSQAIYDTIRQQSPGTRLLTFDTYAETIEQITALERDALDMIEQVRFAGAIISHAAGHHTEAQLRRIIDRGIAVVLVDRCPDTCECDFVGVGQRIWCARGGRLSGKPWPSPNWFSCPCRGGFIH